MHLMNLFESQTPLTEEGEENQQSSSHKLDSESTSG